MVVCLTLVYSSTSEQKMKPGTYCFYYWFWCRTFKEITCKDLRKSMRGEKKWVKWC